LVFSIISNVSNQEGALARGEEKKRKQRVKIQALERQKFEPLTDG